MSADRELLELAAKGAGLALWPGDAWRNSPSGTGLLLANGRWVWNPLHHDGDAFRLLVRAKVTDLTLIAGELALKHPMPAPGDEEDRRAFLRRAIVEAVAARAL